MPLGLLGVSILSYFSQVARDTDFPGKVVMQGQVEGAERLEDPESDGLNKRNLWLDQVLFKVLVKDCQR